MDPNGRITKATAWVAMAETVPTQGPAPEKNSGPNTVAATNEYRTKS